MKVINLDESDIIGKEGKIYVSGKVLNDNQVFLKVKRDVKDEE